MRVVVEYPNTAGQEEETRISEISRIPSRISSHASCLVTIYGPDLGKQYRLNYGETTRIGRGPDNDIILEWDNVSRHHAVVECAEEGCFVRDVGSTNGTYINGDELNDNHTLINGDLIKVGGAILKFLQGGNIEAQFHEEIYRLTIIDGLTQVYNKRYFLEFLDREMARCARYSRPLTLLLFDIDHFKRINDVNGHLAGDSVLKTLAELVSTHIRKEECFARYGGEEFAVIMPERTGEQARVFAEKICRMVSTSEFLYEARTIPVTVSIGIGEMGTHKTIMEFIAEADQKLYEAKANGRNRVEGGVPS